MGLKLNPLTPTHREQFRTAAKEGTPYERFIGLVLLDTGLRRDAAAHMRDYSDSKWYRPVKDPPEILVPGKDECRIGWGARGDPTTKGDALCSQCTRRGEDYWVPKTENSERRVWVHEEDTQQAIEDWFTLHDTVSSPRKISRAIETIRERAEFDRHLTPHQLRQTYGSRLAQTSHTAHEIRSLMGHSSIETSEKYVKLYGPQLRDSHVEKWE